MKRVFFTFYIVMTVTFLVVIKSMVAFVDHSLLSYEVAEDQAEFRGIFQLIINDLADRPESTWAGHVKSLSRVFDYPVRVVAHSNIKVASKFQTAYEAGDLVPLEFEEDFVVRLVMRIPGSGYALVLGPLPELAVSPLFETFLWFSVVFALSIPVLIWILLLWRDMNKLEEAARDIGMGQLSRRVKPSLLSTMPHLETGFNTMAGELERLMASHKALTHAVSHELRTPLARMRFGMEMLKGGPSVEDHKRFCAGLERDVTEMDNLVNEMLTYARFDREPGWVRFENQDVVLWLEELVRAESFCEDGVAVSFDFPKGAHFARFNAQYLGWAVSNLIRNAMRYARGQVAVSLEVLDEYLMLRVDDDGPGIPPEKREAIFEPFARLDESRSRKLGDYGLGLSIVKRIAEAHGGKTWAEESGHGGARLVIRWPRNPQAN